MLDWFVLLTPLLILGVVALLGFVGCNAFYGIGPVLETIPLNQVNPNFGASAGGTPVKLIGSRFTGVNKVTFGGVPTLFNPIDDSEVDTISPPHATGAVDVIVTVRTTDGDGNPIDQDSTSLPFTYVAIGFVQLQANSAPAGASISATLANPTAAGNFLIAAVASGGAATVTVKDNSGNTFTSVGRHPWFQGQAEMFYLPSIPGGTVTVTATGATAPWNICVSEYTGGISLGPVGANSSPSTGTAGVETISGVAVTPAAGNMVGVVVFTTQPPNSNIIPDSAFSPHSSPQDSAALAEDTMNPVTAVQPIATIDTTGKSFLQWVVLAAEIQA